MEGRCGQSGGSGPRSPHGLHPFSLGGKTPFQSFLGMAQQHSSHNGVSRGWGAGAGGRLAGPTGRGRAGASRALSLVPGPPRLLCSRQPAPQTPPPFPPTSTLTPTSAWSRGTSAAPLRCPAKYRGEVWGLAGGFPLGQGPLPGAPEPLQTLSHTGPPGVGDSLTQLAAFSTSLSGGRARSALAMVLGTQLGAWLRGLVALLGERMNGQHHPCMVFCSTERAPAGGQLVADRKGTWL